MEFLKNIKKLYAVSFFNSLILAYVIERLFYQERGMTVQLVVYLEIIYALTITVLEIPTGVLADKFGRKRLIVICSLFSVLEFSLLLFARNFFHFAFITFIAGVGHAFVSGSHNALVYDSLLCAGEERSFEKVLGRLTALEYTGHVLAALSGAVLASYFCFELNYIVSAVSTFIAFVITLTLKEPPVTGKPPQGDETPASAPGHTKQAFKVFKSQPLVLLYCVTGAVLASCAVYIYEFWQIVMEAVGVPVIFDPVGAGATKLRDEVSKQIIDEVKPDIIRGNMSEIRALYGFAGHTKGVEAAASDAVTMDNAIEAAVIVKEMADKFDCVVGATGEVDIISDGETTYFVGNGHPMLCKITGSGCVLSALTGAYAGGAPEKTKEKLLEAVVGAFVLSGLAGESAFAEVEKVKAGTGTFHTKYMDALNLMNADDFLKNAKIYVEEV